MPYTVWKPEREGEYFAITLDRPQFFKTRGRWQSNLPKLELLWDGPCKVRFYLDFQKGHCFCSFIAFPNIKGDAEEWIKAETEIMSKSNKIKTSSKHFGRESLNHENIVKHVCSRIYADLSLDMFEDFVDSGATKKIGINFNNSDMPLDLGQLRATYGESLAEQIAIKAKKIISLDSATGHLFTDSVSTSPNLFIRKEQSSIVSFDGFTCRQDLLTNIPRKFDSHRRNETKKDPIQYKEMFDSLSKYAESTISKVLDDELDIGTIKPSSYIIREPIGINEIFSVKRSFYKGEFHPFFEYKRSGHTDKDFNIKKTLGIIPFAIHRFQKLISKSDISAIQFNKVATNLYFDWRNWENLYWGWQPYKYGPIAIVRDKDSLGKFKLLETFLRNYECLKFKPTEKDKTGKVRRWNYYIPEPDRCKIDWEYCYNDATEPWERVHVQGLVRLYATIQKNCSTHRPSASGKIGEFDDPLVILAAARNETVTYHCCFFEFKEWKRKGEDLFPIIEIISSMPRKNVLELRNELVDFAESAKLMEGKLEMYRALPELRQQIEDLRKRGDLEFADMLLVTIDKEPKFESVGTLPLGVVDWARKPMRCFTSLTRQILTICGLDKEPTSTVAMPPEHYLEELIKSCPELTSLKPDIIRCIEESKKGLLTKEIAKCLDRVFKVLVTILDSRLPNPMPEQDKIDIIDVLQQRTLQIQISGPHAVVVADIYNFENIPKLGEVFGFTYDEAQKRIMEWVQNVCKKVISEYKNMTHVDMANDNIMFGGSDANEVVKVVLDLNKNLHLMLNEKDIRIGHFGFIRTGIAWRENSAMNALSGYRPGVLAYKIGDRTKISPGDICVTKKVYEQLDIDIQRYFEKFEGFDEKLNKQAKEEQEGVYIRRFDGVRDLT